MCPADALRGSPRCPRARETGGCHLTTLCAPAAATSRARLAQRCPVLWTEHSRQFSSGTLVAMACARFCPAHAAAYRTVMRSRTWSKSLGSSFGGPTEVRVGATVHTGRSSIVGSSPGVAEKRILGVFSLRTSEGTMSSSIAFGNRHRWWGIWVIRPSPSIAGWSIGRADGRPRLFVPLHLHAPLQDVGLRNTACRPAEAILGPLVGGLCTILHLSFGE